MRNRIVSGLCDGVLVVESEPKGGSMITAQFAGDQGRQVYAIPGRVDSRLSTGCHQLIRDGATLVSCPEDIMDDLLYRGLPEHYQPEFTGLTEPVRPVVRPDSLSENQMTLFRILEKEGSCDMDTLCEITDIPVNTK
jgi:DNA processing protein